MPIKTITELNGVSLRTLTRATNLLFSSLGAAPVAMPVPAIPEALSKGVINRTVLPWETIGQLKASEMKHQK